MKTTDERNPFAYVSVTEPRIGREESIGPGASAKVPCGCCYWRAVMLGVVVSFPKGDGQKILYSRMSLKLFRISHREAGLETLDWVFDTEPMSVQLEEMVFAPTALRQNGQLWESGRLLAR